nr:MAG TPA: Terminase small subunit [Caudoviricetes sp.]
MSKISGKAKKDYLAGLRYIDIAEKYGVSINTVKSWKRRFHWARPKQLINARKKCTQKNILHPKKISVQKRCTSEKDADCVSVPDIMSEMKEEHKKFCIYYIQSQNAVASYQRAYNCKRSSALSAGYRLLNNVRVKACIQKMKQERNESMLLETGDIIDLMMRIAFANYADFVHIDKYGQAVAKDLEDVDAQLIESVMPTKSGAAVKLIDRKWALNWLSNHFEMNPMDSHKKKYDEKLLELQERKIKNMEEGW